MTEEKIDLTVEEEMDPRINRMIDELTELTYRIDSLSNFLDNHKPDEVDKEEYDWMVNQYLMMVGYANALDKRLRLNGYEVNVVDPSSMGEDTDEQ